MPDLQPEMPGDQVTGLVAAMAPSEFEVGRSFLPVRAVWTVFRFPGEEELAVVLAAEDALHLAAALTKHAHIVQRKLAADQQ